MKRLHVHVAVNDFEHAVGFYATLFAARPSVLKSDYAKWMLDDPRVNFASSNKARRPAATQSPRSRGLKTPRAFRGKLFSPLARASTMGSALKRRRAWRMPRPAARRMSRRRRVKPAAAPDSRPWVAPSYIVSMPASHPHEGRVAQARPCCCCTGPPGAARCGAKRWRRCNGVTDVLRLT